MKFNLRKPCKDCPFIKDGIMNRTLEEGRMEGIVKDISENDLTFQCHKTLPFVAKTVESQHCAGALIYLEREGLTQQNWRLRFAQGLGIYNPEELELEGVEIIDKIENK